MENLQHTPLHSLHLEQQAKMVTFANYHMPLHYQHGIIHEHKHTRDKAGLFDISHMGQIQITGHQAATALERLTPGKISTLQTGQQCYCVFTNPQGGIIDDFVVTRFDEAFMLVVNASQRQMDFAYLQMQLPDSCKIKALDHHALLALQGPEAARILTRFAPDCANLGFMSACITKIKELPCRIFRSGYTGEDGFEISILADHAEQLARFFLSEPDVAMVGLGARDTLRLEAGLGLYGQDLNAEITPVEAGLSWTLRKQADNFPGANVIKSQLQCSPKRKRVGLLPEGKAPIRANTTLINDDNVEVGYISSGGFSPSLGHPIAMGYLQTVETKLGNTVYANIRGRRITVTVTDLPFIKHHYYRKSS